MPRAGKDADEAPQGQLKTPLRVLRRKLRDRRLVSDDQLQIRNEVDYQPSVRAECLDELSAPTAHLGVALAEKRLHEAAECLHQRAIGNVALVLIELA